MRYLAVVWLWGALWAMLWVAESAAQDGDWICVGGDRGCSRYSELNEINRENVTRLEPAWTFHTGELEGRPGRIIECTPVVVDGVAYITTAYRRVIALDGATGRPRWEFDPADAPGLPQYPVASGGVNRGVAYWSDGRPGGRRRILHGTAEGFLFSLDADTGRLDPEFGEQGVVDLRKDLEGDWSAHPYGPTSAPAIYRDAVILGFSCGEGPGVAAPGDIRAFDIATGKQLWRFHTVPRPGQPGNETWEGDSWKQRGAANAWGGLSVDERRGMVFAGLGSAAFDFFGGDRPGDNLFANCTIALDAATGQRRWHFQTLHHDLWDHDLPVYPNLVTLTIAGQPREAVVQVTKTGYVFVFDRQSGRPLHEVLEMPVPASDVPGERASPTQPIPVRPPPFAAQHFGPDNVTNIAPENRRHVLEQLSRLRHGPAFLPPSLQGSVVVPGFHGGANWSGACFDPRSGLLYVNSTNLPNIITLAPAEEGRGFRYQHRGYVQFLDQEGYPAIEPPWGQLNAIDLARGEFAWRMTLGEYPELTQRGVPVTGTENFGGAIVTAGGLVFIGATKDEQFRAFDAATGKELWRRKLPAGGYATPCTYQAGGRQFVLIAAGGAGKLRTKAGDALVAFALSE